MTYFFDSVRPDFVWLAGGAVVALILTIVLCVVLIPSPATSPAPNNVRNLLDLTAEQRSAYLRSFDLVLSDCDGTVWGLTGSIPGAGGGVTALQQKAAKRVVFVSNNVVRSDESYLAQFARESFNMTMADVLHPAIAIIEYLRQRQFDGLIYVVGSGNMRQYLSAAGFRLIDSAARRTIGELFGALLEYVQDGLPVDAVVVDWDSNMELKELLRAESYLVARPESLFLVGGTDDMIPFPQPVIGPGVLVRMLEEAVGRKALEMGKPGAGMATVVMGKYAVTDPQRVLFVGDTLSTDVGFGKRFGFQTLAVLTGSTSLEEIAAARADEVPDYYLPSIADFVEICRDI